ncbi:MAG: hypothetical protein PHN72_01505 [Bacilli bacterium]|nr:hypothetical protein [Bacilli bacterium]
MNNENQLDEKQELAIINETEKSDLDTLIAGIDLKILDAAEIFKDQEMLNTKEDATGEKKQSRPIKTIKEFTSKLLSRIKNKHMQQLRNEIEKHMGQIKAINNYAGKLGDMPETDIDTVKRSVKKAYGILGTTVEEAEKKGFSKEEFAQYDIEIKRASYPTDIALFIKKYNQPENKMKKEEIDKSLKDSLEKVKLIENVDIKTKYEDDLLQIQNKVNEMGTVEQVIEKYEKKLKAAEAKIEDLQYRVAALSNINKQNIEKENNIEEKVEPSKITAKEAYADRYKETISNMKKDSYKKSGTQYLQDLLFARFYEETDFSELPQEEFDSKYAVAVEKGMERFSKANEETKEIKAEKNVEEVKTAQVTKEEVKEESIFQKAPIVSMPTEEMEQHRKDVQQAQEEYRAGTYVDISQSILKAEQTRLPEDIKIAKEKLEQYQGTGKMESLKARVAALTPKTLEQEQEDYRKGTYVDMSQSVHKAEQSSTMKEINEVKDKVNQYQGTGKIDSLKERLDVAAQGNVTSGYTNEEIETLYKNHIDDKISHAKTLEDLKEAETILRNNVSHINPEMYEQKMQLLKNQMQSFESIEMDTTQGKRM